MAARLTAIDIATRALRRIGEVAPRDEPDGHVLARALEELDTIIADVVSRQQTWWFVRTDVTITLNVGQPVFAVPDVGAEPTQSVLEASIEVSGQARPFPIVPLREYEAIDNKEATGTPEVMTITRSLHQTQFRVWPVPEQAYRLDLVVAVESADVTKATGRTPHGLKPQWQGWAILATAHAIGCGPVRSLPIPEQRELERLADKRLMELLAYENRPPRSSRRQTKAYF